MRRRMKRSRGGQKAKKSHKMINQIALKEGYKHTLQQRRPGRVRYLNKIHSIIKIIYNNDNLFLNQKKKKANQWISRNSSIHEAQSSDTLYILLYPYLSMLCPDKSARFHCSHKDKAKLPRCLITPYPWSTFNQVQIISASSRQPKVILSPSRIFPPQNKHSKLEIWTL